MCDLQGPKIRTGTIQTPCLLTKGNEILVTPDHVQMGNAQKFQIKYPELVSKLDVGSYIMLDHGKIQLQVTQKLERELVCSIIVGGALQSHTTCNFPEQKIDLSGKVFEKDMKDLIHICELKPHYVAVSYVSQPEDIHRVRNVLINHQLSRVKILAKLEHQNSIANMDEIIKVSDGIIIVRGELGIEIESWKVPSIQKKVIQLCHNEGKPVIIDAQVISV